MRRHKMGHGQYRTANDNHHWHCRGIRHISVFHVKQHVDANQDFNKERKCLSSKSNHILVITFLSHVDSDRFAQERFLVMVPQMGYDADVDAKLSKYDEHQKQSWTNPQHDGQIILG